MVQMDLERIRNRREALCMTQDELAAKAGVSVRTIYNIEHMGAKKNPRTPRLPTRKRILEVLDIPVTEHYVIFGPLPRR